jgi:hypothetical protein
MFYAVTVGVALWPVMGVANILILAASAIVVRVIAWETKKQKRGLARRESHTNLEVQ